MKWLAPLLLLFSPLFASPDILVTVPPTHFLVKKITEDTLSTRVLVPPGVEPHSFELKAKELIQLTSAKIWFQIGESWERRASTTIGKKMRCVDLRKEMASLIQSNDPHIWLSPKLLIEQVLLIEKSLSEIFPEKKAFFKTNLEKLIRELEALDKEIVSITKEAPHRTFLTVHPAFGYFCSTYGFTQLPIEKEGKEPSAKELVKLIQEAKEAKVDTIVISPEYPRKEADCLAKELHARLISLDPYAEDVITNLKKIATELSK